MVGTVREVAGGLGDAVIVVIDARGSDDVVDVIEAEAQLLKPRYVRLVAVYRRSGNLDRVVEHSAGLFVEPGPAVVLDDTLGEDRVSGEAPQLGAVVGKSEDAAVLGADDHPDHLPLHTAQT